jgi:hypothetical protein
MELGIHVHECTSLSGLACWHTGAAYKQVTSHSIDRVPPYVIPVYLKVVV